MEKKKVKPPGWSRFFGSKKVRAWRGGETYRPQRKAPSRRDNMAAAKLALHKKRSCENQTHS